MVPWVQGLIGWLPIGNHSHPLSSLNSFSTIFIIKKRIKERNPLFRTTNMDYGRKPPTVHEMPVNTREGTITTCFHVSPHTFTDHLIKFGMYRNTGINTSTEKSDVTGPDNLITYFDTFNFHPSYRTGGPSFCE
ncbi:piercer of microtubule wall 1 protein isoform X3 [Eublepharis macularius]|uniref:Piercer of microtubule wall 1 protein isoform X3 n=1 Tax=Eublepharis macularius TaxID=481883 RepID=A0AA97KBE1_EUBMA|nr:piercer of microtubule wall 1 protein isoform X3 [Eublepharis macularius]